MWRLFKINFWWEVVGLIPYVILELILLVITIAGYSIDLPTGFLASFGFALATVLFMDKYEDVAKEIKKIKR